MKRSLLLFVILFLVIFQVRSQVSFTMNPSTCVGGTAQATASSGTISSPSYSWGATPAGVIFSSTNSPSPVLTFSASGVYTVFVALVSGTTTGFAQNIIVVNATPGPTLVTTSTSVCAGFNATLTGFGGISYTWTGSTFTGGITQPSISVGPGTYTVLSANANGCITSSTYTIYLKSPLNISVSPPNPTTCITFNGDGVTPKLSKAVVLSPAGAASYTWFPSPGIPNPFPAPITFTVKPTITTQYTVVGATSICSGTSIVTVSVNPQFTIAVSPALATICTGEKILLSHTQTGSPATSPFTYGWIEQDQSITTLNSSTLASVFASPLNKRSYTLEIWDANSCVSAPTSLTIDVMPCTNIQENLRASDIKIYPNPFDEEIIVETGSGNYLIELRDGLGRLILTKEISSQNTSQVINTDILVPGVYVLRLTSRDGELKTLKIVKN